MADVPGGLDRRLARCALTMALRPGLDSVTAVDTLRTLAAGNRTALLRAIARIRGGIEARSGPAAERAADALRLALAMVERGASAEFLLDLNVRP